MDGLELLSAEIQKIAHEFTGYSSFATKHVRCRNFNAHVLHAMLDGLQITHSDLVPHLRSIKSLFGALVREWSEIGAPERWVCFNRLVDSAVSRYPSKAARILVPGCGLGRLCYEFASRGFTTTGVEVSVHSLVAMQYILTRTAQDAIYPWIHTNSNHLNVANQTMPAYVPDVYANGLKLDIVFGDFVQVYSSTTCAFDAVVTCFFVDTARDLKDYIGVIKNILVAGGHWINIGPLQFHHEGTPGSCEYTLEEFKMLVIDNGFDILEQDMVSTTYGGNPHSMLQYVYSCWYFTAAKRA